MKAFLMNRFGDLAFSLGIVSHITCRGAIPRYFFSFVWLS